MSAFLERIVLFLCDETTQGFFVFWSLWYISGNARAWWQGDWSYGHMTRGFHAAFWALVGLFGSWFTLHSKAVLYPGSATAALLFSGGVIGGLAYQTYANVTWLIGLDPKYRRLGREPEGVRVSRTQVSVDLGHSPPQDVSVTTVTTVHPNENKQEEPTHG